jgi:hypothetical protein
VHHAHASRTRVTQRSDAVFKLAIEDNGVLTTCELCSIFDEDFEEVSVVAALA